MMLSCCKSLRLKNPPTCRSKGQEPTTYFVIQLEGLLVQSAFTWTGVHVNALINGDNPTYELVYRVWRSCV